MTNNKICAECKSTNIHAANKGFSGAKAVVGGLALGGIGLLGGLIGSKKIKLTCLSCGHTWMLKNTPVVNKKNNKPGPIDKSPVYVPSANIRKEQPSIIEEQAKAHTMVIQPPTNKKQKA